MQPLLHRDPRILALSPLQTLGTLSLRTWNLILQLCPSELQESDSQPLTLLGPRGLPSVPPLPRGFRCADCGPPGPRPRRCASLAVNPRSRRWVPDFGPGQPRVFKLGLAPPTPSRALPTVWESPRHALANPGSEWSRLTLSAQLESVGRESFPQLWSAGKGPGILDSWRRRRALGAWT